jgi:hypothetical protein
MIDAVLVYHANPATCGVSKFSYQLAQRLSVPCLPLIARAKYPLYSVKFAEIDAMHALSMLLPSTASRPYDVFLHDVPCSALDKSVTQRAKRVYAGNPEIARAVRLLRPDVIEAFCPSTIQGNPHRANLNVLVFGMANKLDASRYVQLKALLDATAEDYTVSISTAVHEGSPWSEVAEAGDRMRAIFGDCTRVLGYLADDALARELQECSAVAMFFDPAVRANNTTFWAALGAGKAVISNRDVDSPQVGGWYDINELVQFPDWRAHHQNASYFEAQYGWDRLLEIVKR